VAALLRVSPPASFTCSRSDTGVGICHDHALILYVYLPNDSGSDDSVLTASGMRKVYVLY